MTLADSRYFQNDLRIPQSIPNSLSELIQRETYKYMYWYIELGLNEHPAFKRIKFIDLLKARIPIISSIKGFEYIAYKEYVRTATRLIFKKETEMRCWDLKNLCEDRQKKANLIFNIAFASIMSGIRRDFYIKVEEKAVAKMIESRIDVLTR